jgi:WD40 repeat protein
MFLLDVVVVGGVPQGSNLRKLVEDDLDPNVATIAVHAEWSVDLDAITPGYQGKIVFTGSTTNGQTGSVNVISMYWDGTTAQPVNGPNSSVALFPDTVVALPYPTWSGDGSRIAFGAISGSGSGIHVIDAVTGAILTVISTGLGSGHLDFQWSRTDSRVAFAHNNGSIYTVDVNLGAGSLTAVPGVSGRSPAWSPNDQFIAFSSNGEIRRADIATGQQITLAKEKNKSFAWPDWRRF